MVGKISSGRQVAIFGPLAVITTACAPAIQQIQPAGTDNAYPMVWLDNGEVRALVTIPDIEKGFYQGTRFDASANVIQVERAGHTYFGQWRPHAQGQDHDSIWGLAGEFGIEGALGYDEVGAGGKFVKIGVGVLRRKDEKPYHFMRRYTIAQPPRWQVKIDKDQMTFSHQIKPVRGWGYALDKQLNLTDDGLIIRRTLTNTGTKTIDTDHYNHNFFRFDDIELVDSAYSMTVPFDLDIDKASQATRKATTIDGGRISPGEPLESGSIWLRFNAPDDPKLHEVVISHAESRAMVRIVGDTALSRLVLWSKSPVFCPEPFVKVHLAPGESMTWSSRYHFGALPGE